MTKVQSHTILFTVAPPGELRLDEARDRFLNARYGEIADKTIAWYGGKLTSDGHWHGGMLQSLVDFFGPEAALASLTLDHLRRWRAVLLAREKRKEISIFTVDSHVRAVKGFFGWLTAEGVLPENPATRLERPKLPKRIKKGVSDDTAIKMLAAARKLPTEAEQIRAVAILRLLEVTAARLTPITEMKLGDINWETKRITVVSKGDEEHVVFLLPLAEQALKAWLEVRPAREGVDHVFVNLKYRGVPMTDSGVAQIIRKVKKLAGVKEKTSAHQYRHRTLQNLSAKKMPLNLVADYANHKDVRITRDFYGRVAVDVLQAVYTELMLETPEE